MQCALTEKATRFITERKLEYDMKCDARTENVKLILCCMLTSVSYLRWVENPVHGLMPSVKQFCLSATSGARDILQGLVDSSAPVPSCLFCGGAK